MIQTFKTGKLVNEHSKIFPKVVNVVLSCKTVNQCYSAMTYTALYGQKFAVDESVTSIAVMSITRLLITYLQDTIEHIEHGYHKSEVHEYKTTRTYPDLNDYFDGVEVRFKRSWVRGEMPMTGQA